MLTVSLRTVNDVMLQTYNSAAKLTCEMFVVRVVYITCVNGMLSSH